ncbi:hypothetical protein L9F63_013360, partial [Diploptera punctata]
MYLFTLVSCDVRIDPLDSPVGCSMFDVIKKYGYPAEKHFVTTEDGYILQLFRIPYIHKKPVAVLHHGLGCTSRDWVLLGPNKSLGYLLADEGYDVWLSNFRGSFYSRNHTYLSIKSKQFWDFSWHEIGIYDAPAIFNYIINTTGVESHYHVGYSMGATVLFVLASMKPEYNKNIRLLVAQGPPVFFNGQQSAIFTPTTQ